MAERIGIALGWRLDEQERRAGGDGLARGDRKRLDGSGTGGVMAELFAGLLGGLQVGQRPVAFGFGRFESLTGGRQVGGFAATRFGALLGLQIFRAGRGQGVFAILQHEAQLGGIRQGAGQSEGGDPFAGLDCGTRRDPDFGHGAGEPGSDGDRRRGRGEMLAGAQTRRQQDKPPASGATREEQGRSHAATITIRPAAEKGF